MLPPPPRTPHPQRTQFRVNSSSDPCQVEFWTDVEGNYDYFEALLSRSVALFEDSSGSLELRDKFMFVHGGDCVDKGPGDIRVVRALVALKRRYPDRVFLLLGNRDINKLRFGAELADPKNDTPAGDTTDAAGNVTQTEMPASNLVPYWDKKTKQYAQYCTENNLEIVSQVSTLKWMLECTMGSATTFETRKQELSILKSNSQVTDEEVLESFRASVDPDSADPWMLEMLRLGQLMVLIGDTVFVHGGFTVASLGAVPDSVGVITNIDTWAQQLNYWKNKLLQEYEQKPGWFLPTEGGAASSNNNGVLRGGHEPFAPPMHKSMKPGWLRGGQALMDYCVPGGANDCGVVYRTWLKDGNCLEPDALVVNYLLSNNIKRVVVGHVPHGDCPSIIRHSSDLCIVMGDTSYSDMGAPKDINPANMRGKAVSMIWLREGATTVQGKLTDGSPHGYTIHTNSSNDRIPFALVGRQLTDDSWVKTVSGGKVLVAKGQGFRLPVTRMAVHQVAAQLKQPLPYTVRPTVMVLTSIALAVAAASAIRATVRR